MAGGVSCCSARKELVYATICVVSGALLLHLSRCIFHLRVNGSGFSSLCHSRHRQRLHAIYSSIALVMLPCSRRLRHRLLSSRALRWLLRSRFLVYLRAFDDHNREVLQLVAVFLDPRKPSLRRRFMCGGYLFLGIFSLMSQAEGAIVPPVFG